MWPVSAALPAAISVCSMKSFRMNSVSASAIVASDLAAQSKPPRVFVGSWGTFSVGDGFAILKADQSEQISRRDSIRNSMPLASSRKPTIQFTSEDETITPRRLMAMMAISITKSKSSSQR